MNYNDRYHDWNAGEKMNIKKSILLLLYIIIGSIACLLFLLDDISILLIKKFRGLIWKKR